MNPPITEVTAQGFTAFHTAATDFTWGILLTIDPPDRHFVMVT